MGSNSGGFVRGGTGATVEMKNLALKELHHLRSRRADHLRSKFSPALLAALLFPLSCSNSSPPTGSPSFQVERPAANAFPAAIGFGAVSKGGAQGQIIPVTTLDDAGPGSYRACVEAKGPRVCVFKVDGVIRFAGRPPIITEPYLTIAGQTAPRSGITLTHSGAPDGRTPLVIKNTHDVVVRHIRVRLDRPGGDRKAEDAITIENSHNIVIDHVSASGARDEIINGFGDNDNVTISNSIFAYGVPRHDKCALLGSDPVDRQSVSFIGNICAHNGDRNPDMNFPRGSCVEVINNVLYNAQSEFAEVWEGAGGTPALIIGNTFIAGPDTRLAAVGIENEAIGSTGRASIYAHDNRFLGKFTHVSRRAAQVMAQQPSCSLTIEPSSSAASYQAVLGIAGAYPRDIIDRQVVDEVKSRSGTIGYWPRNFAQASNSVPYLDRDLDGMDDEWEKLAGADPRAHDPWDDADGDGISNFEAFLSHREAALQP